jgi:gluconate 5-dehydrogenase
MSDNFSQSLTGLFDLTGRVAYVPGGYGGIGEAVAWGLALAGAQVAVSGRSAEKAQAERHGLGI